MWWLFIDSVSGRAVRAPALKEDLHADYLTTPREGTLARGKEPA
jgi:hypothetical protein